MSPVVVPPPEIVSSPAEPIIWSLEVPPVIVKSISTVSRELLTLNVAEPTFLAERSTVIAPAFNAAVYVEQFQYLSTTDVNPAVQYINCNFFNTCYIIKVHINCYSSIVV